MDLIKILRESRGNEFRLTMPEQPPTVTHYGVNEIWYYLSHLDSLPKDRFGYCQVNYAGLQEGVGDLLVTKEGRIAKRYASYLWKTHQMRLTDAQISEIGNIASKFSQSDGGEFTVNFVADMSDLWMDGDYGDSGSCYFGSNRAAPPSIFFSGGAGLTVHHRDRNFGRCWIVQPGYSDSGVLALWNWYGINGGERWKLPQLCNLLTVAEGSPFQGAAYRAQNLGNRNCGCVYINTTGAILHAPDYTEVWPERYELRIEEIAVDNECYSCGCAISPDETYRYDGEDYCADCNPMYECDACNREADREDMVHIDGVGAVCPRCIDRDYIRCDDCHEWVRYEDSHILENSRGWEVSYCPDCYPGVECADCREDFHPDNLTGTTDGRDVCDSCLGSSYTECRDCHEYTPNAEVVEIERPTYTTLIDVYKYCASCAEKYSCTVCHNGGSDIWIGSDNYVCRPCYAVDYSLMDLAPQAGQLELVI